MNISIFKKRIIAAAATAAIAFSSVFGALPSFGGNSISDSLSVTAEAADLKTAVFPVNNGMKVGFIYGYSKAYGGTHSGLDIHAGKDNKVYCAVAGKVCGVNNECGHKSAANERSKDYGKCKHYNSWGNSVYVLGDDGLYYIYGHLAQNSMYVKKGQRVEAGQALAKIGSSGCSTGDHLHFEVRKKLGTPSSKINVNKNKVFKYVNGPYFVGEPAVYNTDKIVDGGIYTISPAADTTISITAAGGANKSNALLKTTGKNNKYQQWKAVKTGKYYYFVNVKTGKYLDTAIASVDKAANQKNVWTYEKQTSKKTAPTQQFKAVYKEIDKSSYYAVTLYNTSFSLDAAGDCPQNGSNLQIYKLTGGSDNLTQQWVFKKI